MPQLACQHGLDDSAVSPRERNRDLSAIMDSLARTCQGRLEPRPHRDLPDFYWLTIAFSTSRPQRTYLRLRTPCSSCRQSAVTFSRQSLMFIFRFLLPTNLMLSSYPYHDHYCSGRLNESSCSCANSCHASAASTRPRRCQTGRRREQCPVAVPTLAAAGSATHALAFPSRLPTASTYIPPSASTLCPSSTSAPSPLRAPTDSDRTLARFARQAVPEAT